MGGWDRVPAEEDRCRVPYDSVAAELHQPLGDSPVLLAVLVDRVLSSPNSALARHVERMTDVTTLAAPTKLGATSSSNGMSSKAARWATGVVKYSPKHISNQSCTSETVRIIKLRKKHAKEESANDELLYITAIHTA